MSLRSYPLSLSLSITQKFQLLKELSKSGITLLVLISVLGGYLIGQPSETSFEWKRLLFTLCGMLFLASGSSALNQYQEREIDAQMPRTSGRPLPSGRIQPPTVLLFVATSILLGLSILGALDPSLLALGVLAIAAYNGLYTLWWKKYWAYAAIPGAIPGALPILMGHVAADGTLFAPAGIYLFFVLFYWQMPHFWVLALRYQKDYEMGGFPILPIKHGRSQTLRQIIIWCLGYIGLVLIAPLFLRLGWTYLVPTLITSAKVLYELTLFVKKPDTQKWLHFFLWVNFSLIIYLAAAAIDLWSYFI